MMFVGVINIHARMLFVVLSKLCSFLFLQHFPQLGRIRGGRAFDFSRCKAQVDASAKPK